MNTKPITAVAALIISSALAFTGCAANETGAATDTAQTLSGKGASSMKAAQEKWVAEFQTAHPGITVNYSPDGSGAGRSAFIAGAVQFAGSDRPLKDDEMRPGSFAACAPESSALNLPVYVSPIAIIYNVAGIDELSLSPETAAGIFAGTITTWDDPAIAKDNPGISLPKTNITAVHRADDSGTTNNFTDTLSQLAPSVWTQEAADTWPADMGGEAATGTSGVVAAVKNGKGTIGYADASQAKEVGVATLIIAGTPIAPSAEAAAAVVDVSPTIAGRSEHDLGLRLDRTSEGVYPAVLVSYAIVCESYAQAGDAKLVKDYLGYIASAEGQQAAATAAGAAPLSTAMQAKVLAAVDSIK